MLITLALSYASPLNIKDDVTGQTPLDCAIARDHTEIASLLRKYGGKTSEELKVQRN
jgi:ankyrin repeat protein